jgi:hypothetical protein
MLNRGDFLKGYMPGFIIALIIFIILDIVDSQVYHNVMSFTVIISFLVSYVVFSRHSEHSKHTMSAKEQILRYIIFVCIFLVSVYLSLPGFTYNQAKEKMLNNHDIDIVETYIVPIHSDEWNPFATKWAYWFEGYNSKQEKISIMVIPNTGKVFVKD